MGSITQLEKIKDRAWQLVRIRWAILNTYFNANSCWCQVNAVSVTSSHFPNHKTFVKRDEFCILVNKLVKSCSKPAKYYVLVKFYPKICDFIYGVRVWK